MLTYREASIHESFIREFTYTIRAVFSMAHISVLASRSKDASSLIAPLTDPTSAAGSAERACDTSGEIDNLEPPVHSFPQVHTIVLRSASTSRKVMVRIYSQPSDFTVMQSHKVVVLFLRKQALGM
jgi:hypothetical protein